MPNTVMKTISTLLLALCLFGQAQAVEEKSEQSPTKQQTSFLLNSSTYNVPEGLSQSNITSIAEDNDNYVWIGTVNGLNKFDGKVFKHYYANSNQGLPSSFIRSILFDKTNRLLVGTDNGLAVYDKLKDKFFSITSKELGHSKRIWSLSEFKSGILIGTENEVYITDFDLNVKRKYHGKFNGVKQSVYFNGHIYLRTYSGKIFKITKNNKITNIIENANDLKIINERLLVLTKDGIIDISKDNNKNININDFSHITKNNSDIFAVKSNYIYKIDKDINNILIGHFNSNGITASPNIIYRGKNSTYLTDQSLGLIVINDDNNLISSLDITRNNVWSISHVNSNVLIATDEKDLSLYGDDLNLIMTYATEFYGPKSAVMINNDIFIATTEGVISIDTESGKTITIDNDSSFVLIKDLRSNSIISGTSSGYILEYNFINKSLTKTKIDDGNPIFDIKVHEDSIFIATQGGLFQLKDNIVSTLFNSKYVVSLVGLNDYIYFGTGEGILRYDLSSNEISLIYNNKKPIFALSVNRNSIIATSIKEVIIVDTETDEVTVLTDDFGSQDEYNAHSILTLNDRTFLGGINGISYLSTRKIKDHIKNTPLPIANLEALLIFNITENVDGKILTKQLSLTDNIKLKYSDYPFTLKFNTPGNTFDQINYVYQMDGLSDAWVESKGLNSATYTNLSPGEYNFTVYAIDPLTKNHGKHRIITIVITPPWWLSPQAKFIYFMLSLIISGLIVKAILRRREVQNQIAKSEERLKLSLWGSGDEMWDWDIETGQIYRSNIWGSLEFPRDGQRSGEAGEKSNIHPMDQERVSTALNDHFDGKSDHFEAAYRVKGKSGDWVWILDRAKIVERDEKDNPLRMTGTIKNINNFKHAEEQLKLFERAIANISEGMFILDSGFKFVEVNEACCELCLKPRDKFIGEQFNFDLYPDSYSAQIRTILNQQGRWSNDVESAKGDGSSFLMELTVDAIYDELGQLSHYVGVFSDISRRKQQEEELRKLTNNDLLTNLPNRSSLMVTLGNLVKRDSHHTLMVLDLDNFKKINDSLGHQVGDELLIKVAGRIEAAVPYHTSIYRLGGDEFAILVDDNPDIGSSAIIANNVIEAFVTPFELTLDKVVVGMSIGIVLYPEDDQNEQALLRKADIAMYHAKSAGGNRYQFYSESLNRNAIRQLEVENLIRQGIREDLFEVYYQAKINLKSGKMAGMEALVRLNHPEHGLIPPNDFIPLAEENGLIVEIGDIVLKKACFATQKWRSQGIFNGRVAVNLSSYQFALPDLQQRIESILRLTQLPAANLELEITEGTVIKEPEKAIKVMQQLSKMGVSLALDDFGTGYSSLSYLKRFPIHTLKIDKAFVDDIDKSDRDLKMVDSIITIAHNMGLSVVAEGVEDASQLSILKALNCEDIQGFIFSKPVTEAEFTKLLNKEFIEPALVQSDRKAI